MTPPTTKADAKAAAVAAGHENPSASGFPGHRYGCRLWSGDGWLIARGAVLADLRALIAERAAAQAQVATLREILREAIYALDVDGPASAAATLNIHRAALSATQPESGK